MEHVTVLADFDGAGHRGLRYADMFVNEHGHLIGLPRNEAATQIYRRNTIKNDPRYNGKPESLDFIVGVAVLFRSRVWK